MRRVLIGLTTGLLLAAPAGAQPKPGAPPEPGRPSTYAPPPAGNGQCTQAAPCRAALGENFYYTPSGDRRYLTRR